MQNKKEVDTITGPDLRQKLDPNSLSWDIFLFDVVTPQKIAEIIQHMLVLDATDIKGVINLIICSPGGSCGAGYALIDIMRSLRHPVRTIALGEVCSMGSLIFIAGTPGSRLIGGRALVLFHPLSDMMQDYSPYLHDRVKSLDKSNGFNLELLSACTSLPKDMVDKAENGELWLDAGEAVKYKVADAIISDLAEINKIYAKAQKKKGK